MQPIMVIAHKEGVMARILPNFRKRMRPMKMMSATNIKKAAIVIAARSATVANMGYEATRSCQSGIGQSGLTVAEEDDGLTMAKLSD